MESGAILDEQIIASSEYDGNHAAKQGRLNFLAVPGKAGSWSARTNDANQWIQVKLPSNTKISRFSTQGRNAFNQWVTKYQLMYSEDGLNFHYYHERGQSSPKVQIFDKEIEFRQHKREIRLENICYVKQVICRY